MNTKHEQKEWDDIKPVHSYGRSPSPHILPYHAILEHHQKNYGKLQAINASALKLLNISPLKYWHQFENPLAPPFKPTKSMELGIALHSLVLEGEERWAIVPSHINRRTKVGKAEYQEFLNNVPPDVPILKQEDAQEIENMAEVLYADEEVRDLLDGIVPEKTLLWKFRDGKQKFLCKARLDGWKVEGPTIHIIDLKTTMDASPEGFARAILNYQYHIQAAFYIDGASVQMDNTNIDLIRFTFIAIETKPPYAHGIYELTPEALNQGRRTYEKAFGKYIECTKIQEEIQRQNEQDGTSIPLRNAWPSYRAVPQLNLPRYGWDSNAWQEIMGE